MGSRVTYPNEGVYAGGKARWEVYDDLNGNITSCRLATPQEEQLARIEANLFEIYNMIWNRIRNQ